MKLSPYRQTQLVIWGNQLLFFAFLLFNFSWYLLPIAVVMLYIFGFMSESSLHRYFTHKSFVTGKMREKLLIAFAFLTGQGATISWVTVHRTHHAFEDQPGDPHSPHYLKWWQIYLAFLPPSYKNNLVLDLMRSKNWSYFIFENNNYFLMWCALWVTTLIVSPLLFFCVISGSAMWYIATCVVNIVSHSRGKKDFPTAVAYNSKLVNWFTGVGHHNNHHKFPKSYTYSQNGEIDLYAILIEKLLMIK